MEFCSSNWLGCLGLSYYSLARSRANSLLLEQLNVLLLVTNGLRHRNQASLLDCASGFGLCFLHLGIAQVFLQATNGGALLVSLLLLDFVLFGKLRHITLQAGVAGHL